MSSNEEYLDSLLKAVTTGESIDTEKNDTGAAQEESMSSDMLNKMVANVENLDIDADSLENSGQVLGTESEEGEKAFSDPGALFFEGEEDDELADEELFISDNDEESYNNENEEDLFFGETIEDEDTAESLDAEDNSEREIEPDLADIVEEALSEDMSVTDMDTDIAQDTELPVEPEEAAGEDIVSESQEAEEDEDLFSLEDLQEEEIQIPENLDLPDSEEEEVDGEVEEGFKEINDLLAASDENEEDMFAMLENMNGEEDEPADIGFFEEEQEVLEEEIPEKKKRRKKEKKKRVQQEETGENTEALEAEEVGEDKLEKKEGFFSKLLKFLTEEDGEEQQEGILTADEQAEELSDFEIPDENAAILEELEKEDSEKDDKKKKKKKGKKEKGKGKKGEEAEGEETEGEEQQEEKKAKKPKKEKKKREKEESEYEKPAKKLSVKKIEVIAIFCLSLTAAIILVVYLVPGTLENARARDAYYDKDYETVVADFYGKKLEDSDELMYNRALVVMKMQRKIDGYNNYARMGKGAEALNQLIEGIFKYEEIYPEAQSYNITAEVDGIYQTIVEALQNSYGLSVSEAKELYATEDNFEYTLKLEAIVDGTEYIAPVLHEENDETGAEQIEESVPSPEDSNAGNDSQESGGQETEAQSELLPEEEELLN